MGRIRVLATRIEFTVHEENENGTFDMKSRGSMDYSGHIDVDQLASRPSRKEYLLDNELAIEAVPYGNDGGAELFATGEFLAPFKEAFRALPQGWRDWPFSDRRFPIEDTILSDEQWTEFFNRLDSPEGCDFQEVDGKARWECGGGSDQSLARAILDKMGVPKGIAEAALRLCADHGGHCDCEIIFNAREQLQP